MAPRGHSFCNSYRGLICNMLHTSQTAGAGEVCIGKQSYSCVFGGGGGWSTIEMTATAVCVARVYNTKECNGCMCARGSLQQKGM